MSKMTEGVDFGGYSSGKMGFMTARLVAPMLLAMASLSGCDDFGVFGSTAPPVPPDLTYAGPFLDLSVVDQAQGGGRDMTVLDLAQPDLTLPTALSFTALPAQMSGNQPRMVVAADFNGDKNLDVAVANESGTVGVLLGDGTGKLGLPIQYPANLAPWALALGDFDWDGKADVVVANESSDKISVLPSLGNGAFGVPVQTSAGHAPFNVAVGDFNDDGRADVAVSNSGGSPDVTVLLGNGAGTFKAGTTLFTGAGPAAQALVSDFNGDGKDDIAATVSGANVASIFLRNGQATFAAPANVDVGASPFGFVAARIVTNKIDLVVTDENIDSIAVLPGNNNGTFQPRTTLATGKDPRHVAVADFNLDGKMDIVTSDFGANTVSVILASPLGGFLPAQTFAVGASPRGIAVADLNGDGKPDIIVPNYAGNTITVLLNTSH